MEEKWRRGLVAGEVVKSSQASSPLAIVREDGDFVNAFSSGAELLLTETT